MAFGLKKDCKETINPNIARWDLNWKIWQHAESHFYQFSCFRFLLCTCDSTDVSLITSVVKIVVACFMSLSDTFLEEKKFSLNIQYVHNSWFHVFIYMVIVVYLFNVMQSSNIMVQFLSQDVYIWVFWLNRYLLKNQLRFLCNVTCQCKKGDNILLVLSAGGIFIFQKP